MRVFRPWGWYSTNRVFQRLVGKPSVASWKRLTRRIMQKCMRLHFEALRAAGRFLKSVNCIWLVHGPLKRPSIRALMTLIKKFQFNRWYRGCMVVEDSQLWEAWRFVKINNYLLIVSHDGGTLIASTANEKEYLIYRKWKNTLDIKTIIYVIYYYFAAVAYSHSTVAGGLEVIS